MLLFKPLHGFLAKMVLEILDGGGSQAYRASEQGWKFQRFPRWTWSPKKGLSFKSLYSSGRLLVFEMAKKVYGTGCGRLRVWVPFPWIFITLIRSGPVSLGLPKFHTVWTIPGLTIGVTISIMWNLESRDQKTFWCKFLLDLVVL